MSKNRFPLDLNSDLGEGMENDAQLMPFLGSCNIACGGHCGDEASMTKTISLAKLHNVKVGAHPSYPDRINFGRSRMEIEKNDLKNALIIQIKTFQNLCKHLNVSMHHVKPHGALYNFAAEDEGAASLIVDLLLRHFPDTILYCPPQSVIADLAIRAGLPICKEVFADRGYQDDLSLLPRQHPQALFTDVATVLQHVQYIVNKKCIRSISGLLIPIQADTLCVHGDNPNALNILKSIVSEYEV